MATLKLREREGAKTRAFLITQAGMTESPLKSSPSKTPTLPPLQINTNGNAKTKKRGTFSLFKAALFMMRPKDNDMNNKKKKKSDQLPQIDHHHRDHDHDDDHQVGNWTKFVGSMRPLHLQENLNSPPPSHHLTASSSNDSLVDLVPRVSSFSSFSSPSTTTMSQYASASNLQELVDDDNSEEDPDEVFDALTGDDMIDSKAEQFIAQFYQQMKLQNNVVSTFDGY